MLKILLVALLAGLVSSCAMEDPDASGVLVDPNSDTEVPEGLTARDFDFNKDGVIDILDLVIVSKFIGQEVVDESPDTTRNGYKLPDLPEVIYTVVELEQYGQTDLTYASNLEVAMRIQVKKQDRIDALRELRKASVFSDYDPSDSYGDIFDRLDVYRFPKIQMKIINGQQKPEQKTFAFKEDHVSTRLQLPFLCNKGASTRSWATSSTKDFSNKGSYGLTLFLYYLNNVKNIQQFRDCEKAYYQGGKKLNPYYEMIEHGVHIGKEFTGNVEDKIYTDTVIGGIYFAYETVNSRSIKYRMRSIYRNMTSSTQQQIKEEHFPEDIHE